MRLHSFTEPVPALGLMRYLIDSAWFKLIHSFTIDIFVLIGGVAWDWGLRSQDPGEATLSRFLYCAPGEGYFLQRDRFVASALLRKRRMDRHPAHTIQLNLIVTSSYTDPKLTMLKSVY